MHDRLDRDVVTVRDAHALVVERMHWESADVALRSAAISTNWPAALTVEQIALMFYTARDAKTILATCINSRHQLIILDATAVDQTAGIPELKINELAVDVDEALAIAGRTAGIAMLACIGIDTQVSLFLADRNGVAVWEVRYDAWRDGQPLRYLVVTIDARTGDVTQIRDHGQG